MNSAFAVHVRGFHGEASNDVPFTGGDDAHVGQQEGVDRAAG